ncbi:MAG: hypothetical protein ACFE7E_01905 [Candidatus Hodarchaeota archaeon]
MAEVVETPFGKTYVLLDSNAREYYEFFKFAEWFTAERRSVAAKYIFGKHRELSNVCHQGLASINDVYLGVQDTVGGNGSRNLLPIALRADLPAYLVKGLPNLSEEIIKVQGFADRAERLGVLERLRRANFAPHGGGYSFPDMLNVREIIENPLGRFFIVEMDHEIGYKIVSNLKGLQFTYRDRTVIVRALELGLIRIVARLIPEYIFKI